MLENAHMKKVFIKHLRFATKINKRFFIFCTNIVEGCPVCKFPKYHRILCGSDGKTYSNDIKLKSINCKLPKEQEIQIIHFSECGNPSGNGPWTPQSGRRPTTTNLE